MIEKTCCVTGHRDIPIHQIEFVKEKLNLEIERAIAQGFTIFLSGFAEGADLYFAQLVMAQMARYPHLQLEAAIPYANRLKNSDPLFQKCLQACQDVHVQQTTYNADCFMNRNRYLVSRSSRVIVVYDGRERGGTLFTMRYAHATGKEIREIRI